jgi:hypothetical protein
MSAPMQSTWPLNVQQQLAPLQVAGLHEPPPGAPSRRARWRRARPRVAAFVLDATVLVVVAPFVAAVVVAPLEATVVAPFDAAVDAAAPPFPQS